jgi:hypothetical protein
VLPHAKTSTSAVAKFGSVSNNARTAGSVGKVGNFAELGSRKYVPLSSLRRCGSVSGVQRGGLPFLV